MQCKVSMDLQFCLSEEHFSLDILVLKLAELFEAKAFAQILRLVLMLLQEVLVMRLLKGKGTNCCCGGNHWRLNGDFNRRIRTRLGAVELPFRRVSCRVCGRTHSPLQRLLKLGRYQTKTNELEMLVVETVGETSYRRGVAQLSRDRGIYLPCRTAHEWVMLTGCDDIVLPHGKMKQPMQIMPDGTAFKVVSGVTQAGEIVLLGSWAGLFCPEVHVQWNNQWRPSRRAASSSAAGNWDSPKASRSMLKSSSGANGTSPATSTMRCTRTGRW